MSLIQLAERRWIPDSFIRIGIRQLLQRRHRREAADGSDGDAVSDDFIHMLRESPLAVETQAANQQHYEVPAEFFQRVLGPRLKYSCCSYEQARSLGDAESEMLELTCQRAELADGMEVLELGCGWGSLTLWIAEHFPGSQITAVSNSNSQRTFIEGQLRQRGLRNARVITADMRDFAIRGPFDRVVSVEMFEHMRNYELLLRRIASWLHPAGKLFVHIFCHREAAYLFETEGDENWMGRHFFTGGMMPSQDLLSRFRSDLEVTRQWQVNGLHYHQTCEHWLSNLDAHRTFLEQQFARDLGRAEARLQLQRWRMFFMACSELFRYERGTQWFVGHYLLEKAGCLDSTRRALSVTG